MADLNAYYRVPEDQVDSSDAWNDALRNIDLRKSYQYFAILPEDRPDPPSEIDYEWTDRVRYHHDLNAHLARPIAGPINLTILNYYEESMALLEHDWPRLIAEQKRLDDSVASRRPSVAWMLLPSQLHVTESAARAEALRRCEFVAIAMRRHKLAYNEIPQSLNQIADEFLTCPAETRILTDPFDGQPLRFQVEENSITIYSIGPDMKDDGGSLGCVPSERVGNRDYGIKIAYPNSGLHLSQTSQP